MELDRPGRDRQPCADLFVGVVRRDESEDFAFAAGELIQLGIEAGGQRAAERVEDEPGQAWGEEGVVGVDLADRPYEVGAGDGFGDVSACAGADQSPSDRLTRCDYLQWYRWKAAIHGQNRVWP